MNPNYRKTTAEASESVLLELPHMLKKLNAFKTRQHRIGIRKCPVDEDLLQAIYSLEILYRRLTLEAKGDTL